MRYFAKRSVLNITAEELCKKTSPAGSIGYNVSGVESARQKYRDSLINELGANMMTDVYLCGITSVGGINYEISAVADVILKSEDRLILYMISAQKKSTRISPFLDSYGICAAMLAANEYDKETVIIRTAFYDISSDKATVREKTLTRTELTKEMRGMLFKIERFARLAINRETCAKSSVKAMKFPFGSMRAGQRELIEETYRAIYEGTRLFASAPTGIGKTISVLYPSVKALGDGLCDKIFYLTAKASTRREAFGAIRKMFDSGAELKAMILSPKEQMCSNAAAKMSGARVSSFCSRDRCEMSRDYFSRAEDALYELLTTANGYTPRLISDTAKKYCVCPYELSLDLSEHCDVIICDYNYVFDPAVKLRRYFGDTPSTPGEKYVFLTDEAHNLPDRARDMYSEELSLNTFKEYLSLIPIDEGRLHSAFEEVMGAFKGLTRLCGDNLTRDSDGNDSGFYFGTSPIGGFTEALTKFLGAIELYINRHKEDVLADTLYELLSSVRAYLSALDYFDEHFRTYILVYGGNITVKVYCIDPSGVINECLERACAAVLFSATLTPIDYYVDILGGAKKAVTLSLPSPFDRKNLCLCAMTGVSTRYEDRSKNASRIATCIAASVLAKKGNYIVYFPSYGYMEQVANHFDKKYPAVNILVQKRGMTYAEKEHFLDFFKDDKDVLRIGFCVLGGSFSEGVDLPGSRLIGSIVVGVGLPQISNELNIIRDFYELKYERGYDYAYTFPGMNKVLQACGRVIRRENDRGIVVLIDDRYESPQYKSLFPEHWENIIFASSASELAKTTEHFWSN